MSSNNVYRRLLALLPEPPTDVGEVVLVSADGCTIELLNGGMVNARGSASLGDLVYVRNGAIEGPAPTLQTVEIEV
jgi:hypothetical protein